MKIKTKKKTNKWVRFVKSLIDPKKQILLAIKFISAIIVFTYLLTIISHSITEYFSIFSYVAPNVSISKPEAEIVKDYSKLDVLIGTPMEDSIEHIKKASEYFDLPLDLYIGIANAESSFRNFECFNPWGIGPLRSNGKPRCYNNWEHAVDGFSHLVRYYYFDEGKNTPDKMWRKYQGGSDPDWKKNVKQYWR